MKLVGKEALLVRVCGAAWIAIAPALWLMAALSKMSSDRSYNLQLLFVSIIAVAGLVSGIGALFRQVWAARGLFALSAVVAATLFGMSLHALLLPVLPQSAIRGSGRAFISIVLAIWIAVMGLPFVALTLLTRRALRA